MFMFLTTNTSVKFTTLLTGLVLVGFTGIAVNAGKVTKRDRSRLHHSQIGDYVWLDENKNGLQDAHEEGIEGVTVTATGKNDDYSNTTTTTDENGYYYFGELLEDEYKISFTQYPEGLEWTEKYAGKESGEADSHVNPGTGETDWIYLHDGEKNMTVDAGLKPVHVEEVKEEVVHPVEEAEEKHPEVHEPKQPVVVVEEEVEVEVEVEAEHPETEVEIEIEGETEVDTHTDTTHKETHEEVVVVETEEEIEVEVEIEEEVEVTPLPAPTPVEAEQVTVTPRTGGFASSPLLYLSTAVLGFTGFKARKKIKF